MNQLDLIRKIIKEALMLEERKSSVMLSHPYDEILVESKQEIKEIHQLEQPPPENKTLFKENAYKRLKLSARLAYTEFETEAIESLRKALLN